MAHLDSLVVLDSNPRSSAALSFGFQREGFKVYSTSNSNDALAMAQARAAQLLIVSTHPGVQDGDPFDLVGKLREEESTKELPIVVLGERGVREPALRAGADEFVTRPAFIRDVVTLCKLAVAMRQDGDAQGVVGLLEDYGLYFLTRALAVAGRSAIIELERSRRHGEVHVSKGEVISARLGRMSALPAFNQLLLWGEASMHLRFESPAGERKITQPVDQVLAQGVEFAQQFDKLAERIGGAQAIYRQSPTRAAEARSTIPAEVMGLVKLFDGKRPFIDVVEDSPFKPNDTVKITYRLAELKAIERVESTHADSPLTAQLAVRDWLLGASAVAEERSTVTEAGRRAAEAYADEEARRAQVKRPSEDLLPVGVDTLVDVPRPALRPSLAQPAPVAQPTPAAAPVPVAKNGSAAREEAAPSASIHDAPTAPRANNSNQNSNHNSNNKKKNKQKQRPQQAQPQRAPEPDATIPFAKISVPPPAPPPVAVPQPAKRVEPARAAQQPAPAKKAEPPRRAEPSRKAEPPRKGDPSRKGDPPKKQDAFSDIDEEFFAKEAELHRVEPVETFDDLDSRPKSKAPQKRSWFGWGEKPTKKK